MSSQTRNLIRLGASALIVTSGSLGLTFGSGVLSYAKTVPTVTFEIPYGSKLNIDPIQTLVSRFNASHKAIHIQLLTNFTSQKIDVELAAGTAPDVVMFGSGNEAGSYMYSGALDDMTPLVSETHFDLNDQVPSVVHEGTLMYNHQLYALTYLEDTYELYYNKADLARAGITTLPTNLNQLVADGKKMTTFNKQGQITRLGWDADIWDSNILFQLFNVPDFNARGTKSVVDNPQAIKALTWQTKAENELGGYTKIERFLSTYENGISGEKLDLGPFETGALAFQINGDYNTGKIQSIDPSLKYGVMLIPPPVGIPGTRGMTVLGGNPMVIAKNAKDPVAAMKFIEWMVTSGEMYAVKHNLLVGNWAATPTYIPILKDPSLTPITHFRWFWHELLTNPNAKPTKTVANESQWFGLRGTYQQDALEGSMSAQHAASTLQSMENADLKLALASGHAQR